MAATDQLVRSEPVPGDAARPRPGAGWRRGWPVVAFLAAVSYVPLLFAAQGQVAADTKQYLYLDPGRLIQSAGSMWDPNIGMGTVSHQNIGYLFPMAPFFWVFHHLGVATWVAQRLWLGTLLFAAGMGVLFLLRVLDVRGAGAPVAALAYMLSPYLLEYAARISAILMPWAGLPWMLAFVILSLRRGGWRHPALFALVVLLVGGVNATSLIYAGIAPVLWFPYAVWVTREVHWKRALATLGRVGVLTVAVSLWWIAGLWVEGAYDLNVLKYTETVKTVSETSLASEVLRGLGYWYFYGGDKLGPWIQQSVEYTQYLWLIGVSFAVPAVAFVGAALLRWRHRLYFVGLVLVGTVISVGAHPFDQPSPLGGVFKAFSTGSTAGLAMRSAPRATPLVILGLAVLLGVGLTALRRRVRITGAVAAALCGALVLANMYPLWAGTIIGSPNTRPEHVPSYWTAAARYLQARGGDPGGGFDSRVLVVPGSDFASYRWGSTIDPVLPGLTSRPIVARELLPYGTAGSVDLLDAFDSRLQEGVFDPAALAPIARLISAGDVLYRADLQYERYNTPRPRPTWALLNPPPPGVSAPVGFGKPGPSAPQRFPMVNEQALAEPPGAPYPPKVAVFGVKGARPLVRAEPTNAPLLVDGDGLGLVYAADAGLLDTRSAVIYSASLAGQPKAMARALGQHPTLVLTDTNRKQERRWGTVRDNAGYIEQAGERPPASDPTAATLPLFPKAGDNARTVTDQIGVRSVTASSYGNPVSFTPEDRAANAFDGNPRTAWTVGDFSNPVGQWLQTELKTPVTTDQMTLVQPLYGTHNRFIKTATLTFDGGHPMKISLNGASRTASGQVVRFPARSFQRVRITVDSTTVGRKPTYAGYSGVGFAEVGIAGQHVTEQVRLPEDLLSAAGQGSINDPLSILLNRQRVSPLPPRTDPENDIVRTFSLPTARTFALSGTARLSALVPDNVIDQLVGRPGSDGSGVTATSSGRLPGDVNARAASAFDGNPATFWSPGFGPQAGNWVQVTLPRTATFDHLNLQVIADGRHSVPTRLRIETDQGSREVTLPPVRNLHSPNATVSVPVQFPALSGSRVRVTVESVRKQKTLDYYSERPIVMPVGISEVGIPGVQVPPVPSQVPSTCRSDLMTVDGQAVDLRIVGSTATAQSLGGLQIQGCGPDSGGLRLSAGSHVVQTTPSLSTGVDLDQLGLSSAAGGGAAALRAGGLMPVASPGPSPKVHVVSQGRTTVHLKVASPGHPFWLVLGQSLDAGWSATLSNGRSLGAPRLVDGYANGWYVNPGSSKGTIDVTLRFTPQRVVWAALAASGLALLVCLALVLLPIRRRRRPPRGRHLRRPAAPGARAVTGGLLPVEPGGEPEQPRLAAPFRRTGTRPHAAVMAAATVLAGGIAAAVLAPWAGLVVAAATLAALLDSRVRTVLLLAAVGLVVATGANEVLGQWSHRYPAELEWATFFPLGNTLAWLAVLALVADAIVVAARGARRRRRPPG